MEAGRVKSALEEVEMVSAMHPIPTPPMVNDTAKFRLLAQEHRDVPVLRPGQDELFRSLWHLDIPIVVRGFRMQGCWTPESFVRTHGRETVVMIKSNGLPSEKVTVARFFEEFSMTESDRGYAVKIKVSRIFHCPCRERSQ